MRVHQLVDYSFLYYKYYFQLNSGRMRRLHYKVGDEEKDISQIYYSIREIENFRRELERNGHEVVISVCFDMPSDRKVVSDGATEGEIKAATNYKSNRVKRFTGEDFNNIAIVEELLSSAGYNTYRIVGCEADDIIANLIDRYSNDFDYNVIYTPDADLVVHVDKNVGVRRYKTRVGYSNIDINNFSQYLSDEFKCNIPYNALMLYKCTVGDSSDNIKGIHRFGGKAFNKLVDYLSAKGVDWGYGKSAEGTREFLEMSRGYLKDSQIQEAYDSLNLIAPIPLGDKLKYPDKKSDRRLRKEAYMRFNMKSLIE